MNVRYDGMVIHRDGPVDHVTRKVLEISWVTDDQEKHGCGMWKDVQKL